MATSTLTFLNPYGASWRDWSAAIVQGYASEYNVPNPVKEGSWSDWATELLNTDAFVELGVPNPKRFTNWRVWAAQAMQALA